MSSLDGLAKDGIGKLLIVYSGPAMAGFLVFGLARFIGNVFVGKFLGTTALAGYTVGNSMGMILLACGVLIATGASVLVSMDMGAGRTGSARTVLGAACIASLIGSVGLMLAGLLFLDPMLRFLGATDDVLPFAADYARIMLAGCFFQILNMTLNGALRAEGLPLKAFLTNLIGLLLNVGFMSAFLLGVPLGIAGIAWAYVVSSAIISLWLASHFLGPRTALRLRLADLRWNTEAASRITKIGMASFLRQTIAPVLSILTNHIAVANGGEPALAVVGVIDTTFFLLTTPLMGIGMGIQPIIAYNHGSGQRRRVRSTVRLALAFSVLICLVELVGVLLCRDAVAGLFTTGRPAIRAMTSRALLLALLAFPVTGIQFVGASFFQATGQAGQAVFASFLRPSIFLVPLLILPHYRGLDGLFMSYPLTGVTVAAVVGLMLALALRHEEYRAGPDAGNAVHP